MTTRRYTLPVETTRWRVSGEAETTFSWDYDEGRDRLLSLYEKGKTKQWNAATLIDWSLEIDPADQGVFPDMRSSAPPRSSRPSLISIPSSTPLPR